MESHLESTSVAQEHGPVNCPCPTLPPPGVRGQGCPHARGVRPAAGSRWGGGWVPMIPALILHLGRSHGQRGLLEIPVRNADLRSRPGDHLPAAAAPLPQPARLRAPGPLQQVRPGARQPEGPHPCSSARYGPSRAWTRQLHFSWVIPWRFYVWALGLHGALDVRDRPPPPLPSLEI